MNNNLINAEDLESSILGENKEFDSNDGIGILVDMAKQGKIDPWHIDILDVTEKYLQRMIELKSLNLRVASRTLLFASILCRLQSNVLAGYLWRILKMNLKMMLYMTMMDLLLNTLKIVSLFQQVTL